MHFSKNGYYVSCFLQSGVILEGLFVLFVCFFFISSLIRFYLRILSIHFWRVLSLIPYSDVRLGSCRTVAIRSKNVGMGEYSFAATRFAKERLHMYANRND